MLCANTFLTANLIKKIYFHNILLKYYILRIKTMCFSLACASYEGFSPWQSQFALQEIPTVATLLRSDGDKVKTEN